MRYARFFALGSIAPLLGAVACGTASPSPDGAASGGAPLAVGGTNSGGTLANAGGSSSGGAITGPSGGSGTGLGGGAASGGSGTPSGGSDAGTGGGTGSGGGAPSGGAGPDVDPGGKENAAPGATETAPQEYLRIGDIRILNNNWGSEDLGCTAPTSTMSVFVNQDRTFGWTFARGDCEPGPNATKSKPDFPQLEFGVHPFGPGSALATSPDYSSTLLLPKQIKDITSATVKVDNLQAMITQTESWDVTFEFWLSERNPLEPNPGVYAELMTFWGWQPNRWPDSGTMPGPTGNTNNEQVESGGKTYKLWVQQDDWAKQPPEAPQGWRYFQFRDNNGSSNTFDGTLDVKKFLDYLVNTRRYSPDLWVTRLEVGSEIDDMTAGTVKMSGVTFTVNGESRSEVIKP
jgi:hypothetical protein